MKLFTVAEMVAAEKAADAAGHSYAAMMEYAGRGLADAILAHWSERNATATGAPPAPNVLILVGPGNNGGDGLVAGRLLAAAGAQVGFYLFKPRDDALVQRLRQQRLFLLDAPSDPGFRTLRARLQTADVVVDALLGTGVARPIGGALAELLQQVHDALAARQAPRPAPRLIDPTALAAEPVPAHPVTVVACDCPSGLNCDTGAVDPLALPADLTVTFAGPKRGHFIFPGAAHSGRLLVADIGLAPAHAAHGTATVATAAAMRACLPSRPADGHKGTFGFALVAAGSADYYGAPLLAGRAALRAGCGLVALAVPTAIRAAVATALPEATYPAVAAADTLDGAAAETLLATSGRFQSLLVGPGLGRAEAFMEGLLSADDLPPLVVDADGLNTLAAWPEWWRRLPPQTVLTPHPGEMSRLLGRDARDEDRVALAQAQAKQWRHVVVLKGAYTVVAAPDGRTTVIPVAHPILAVAGSGDVLAGVIVSLLAQGLPPYDAARLGAYLHAQAGVAAAAKLGAAAGALAGEIAEALPSVRQRLT